MEYANIEIRLSGSRDNTVIKEASAPEIAVYRAIHGLDAIVSPKFSRVGEVSSAEERKRLVDTYGAEIVEKLFPGVTGVLPTTLAAVGIEAEVPALKKGK